MRHGILWDASQKSGAKTRGPTRWRRRRINECVLNKAEIPGRRMRLRERKGEDYQESGTKTRGECMSSWERLRTISKGRGNNHPWLLRLKTSLGATPSVQECRRIFPPDPTIMKVISLPWWLELIWSHSPPYVFRYKKLNSKEKTW